MAEATCRRELELEIPAEEVTKKMESVAKEFARLANVPGFRRGKGARIADPGEVREDIREKCCNRWCRSALRKRWRSRKLTPVSASHNGQAGF